MLLSLSSSAVEVDIDLNSVQGTVSSSDGIPAAQELLNFTDSVHRLDSTLPSTRADLVEAVGEEGMSRICHANRSPNV